MASKSPVIKKLPVTLHIKSSPDDLYERIKNYVTNKGESFDEPPAPSLAEKHFFYFDVVVEHTKGYKLVFDKWEYECPVPTYKDLDLKKYDNKVRIVKK